MPEMPELEGLRAVLGPVVVGRTIEDVAVSPKFGFLLRTPPDDLSRALVGGTVERMWRRGKFLVFDVGERRLVINPMLGGRLHWATRAEKPPPAWLFGLGLDDGHVLRLTDFARMARVYLVDAATVDSVPGWSELGPDADSVSFEEFAQRIRRHPGELKNLLRNQAFIAGIGNAYSDEILHEARLLPLRKRSTLTPDELRALYDATTKVLAESTAAILSQPGYVPHKQDRSYMKVHLHGGEPCPRCGHLVAEISARGEVFNFCRGCQK